MLIMSCTTFDAFEIFSLKDKFNADGMCRLTSPKFFQVRHLNYNRVQYDCFASFCTCCVLYIFPKFIVFFVDTYQLGNTRSERSITPQHNSCQFFFQLYGNYITHTLVDQRFTKKILSIFSCPHIKILKSLQLSVDLFDG